jgi:hypothetical protein
MGEQREASVSLHLEERAGFVLLARFSHQVIRGSIERLE